MKSIKEKQLLVKWSKAMNEPIDTALLEEVERYESIKNEIKQSVRKHVVEDFKIASSQVSITPNIEYPKPPTLDEVLKVLKEVEDDLVSKQTPQEPPVKETQSDLISRAVEHITKEVKLEERADSYQQPNAELPARTINDIRKKIKFLEDWVSKISLTGPGGGAGDTINLDYPVKLVTGDYTLTKDDYYIGVNVAARANITIPDSIGFSGRKVIIKDESGRCSKFPIFVYGNVDNDPGGFILKINNGAIQMIYREGWRII